MKKIRKAIFPVGGLGTRFLPATKSIPKEMLPVFNKPLIQYAFEEACAAGIEQFIFITGRNKNAINNHFDIAYEVESDLADKTKTQLLALAKDWLPDPGSIAFIRQQVPKGLGHAVWCARHYIGDDEAFAVILADELFLSFADDGEISDRNDNGLINNAAGSTTLKEMCKLYENEGLYSIASDNVPISVTNKYGILALDSNDFIRDMVEKPESNPPSNRAVVGRYILPTTIFSYLEKQQLGAGGEIQLTDAIKMDLQDNSYKAVLVKDQRIDCGTEWGLFEANMRVGVRTKQGRDIIEKLLKSNSN